MVDLITREDLKDFENLFPWYIFPGHLSFSPKISYMAMDLHEQGREVLYSGGAKETYAKAHHYTLMWIGFRNTRGIKKARGYNEVKTKKRNRIHGFLKSREITYEATA